MELWAREPLDCCKQSLWITVVAVERARTTVNVGGKDCASVVSEWNKDSTGMSSEAL